MRVAASSLCRLLRSANGETTTGWSALLARGFKRESLADIETLPLEKEPYCRQRTELVLGDRVPVLAPDAFVAPSAVLVGDVDLYNRVHINRHSIVFGSHCRSCRSPYGTDVCCVVT